MITIYAVERAYEGIDPESFTFDRAVAEREAAYEGCWLVTLSIDPAACSVEVES